MGEQKIFWSQLEFFTSHKPKTITKSTEYKYVEE